MSAANKSERKEQAKDNVRGILLSKLILHCVFISVAWLDGVNLTGTLVAT